MTRRLTEKETERRARNRANAVASTGPRTAADEARSSRNAITHGLAAPGPVDGAEVADRDRRTAALALEIAPDGAVERALMDRLAAAFQRLEKADHLEAQLFDGAFRLGDVPPGMRLYRRTDRRRTLAVPGRYRATAAGAMIRTLRTREGRRGARRRAEEARLGKRSQRAGFASGDNDLRGSFAAVPPAPAPAAGPPRRPEPSAERSCRRGASARSGVTPLSGGGSASTPSSLRPRAGWRLGERGAGRRAAGLVAGAVEAALTRTPSRSARP
jgi:hypothetical protein